MKAIRVHKFGGPEVLQLEEIAEPKAGPGQVLVEIKAAGVNPVDTYVRSGSYAQTPPLPYIPGGDAAGTSVLAVLAMPVVLAVVNRPVRAGGRGEFRDRAIEPGDVEAVRWPAGASAELG